MKAHKRNFHSPLLFWGLTGIVPFAACFFVVLLNQNSANAAGMPAYKQLATQKDQPYFRSGRPMGLQSSYGNSILKFPDVRSCLMASERHAETPDLRRMEWSEMESTRDVDVCVFRILSSLPSMEDGRSWFRSQGFELTDVKSAKAQIAIPFQKKGKVYMSYTAVSGTEEFSSKTNDKWTQSSAAHSVTVEVIFSQDNQIQSVVFSINSL